MFNLIINSETWEFAAKTINDLGKNILTVGFASYFFEKLSLPIRVGLGILGIVLILVSIVMLSRKGGK